MAPTKHTRNAALGSLLAAGMLAGGLALPANAQDATAAPSPAPSVSATANTGALDAKAANVKQIDLDTKASAGNSGVSFPIGNSDNMAWKDGAWTGSAYRTPVIGDDLTMTATVTYKDGTKSKPVQLTGGGVDANTPVPLGTTKANSRQFTGVVDGMPIKITYATYDAEPIGFWNLDRAAYATRKAGDDTFRYEDQDTTYRLSKDQDGDGWHGSCEKVIFYNVNREGFNGSYDTLPSLPVTWGEPRKATENGRQILKSTGTAKGTIAGQPVEITLHATADDPDAATDTWTFTDPNGTKQNIWYEGGKMVSSFTATYDKMPKTLTATSADGASVTLNRDDQHVNAKPGDQLGVNTITGSILYTAEATGTHPAFQISGNIDGDATIGTPVTIKDGPAFTRNDDGTFTATDSNYTLDGKNQPSSDTVTLSNGQTAPITWEPDVQTVKKDTDGASTLFIRRSGTATGTVGEQKFTVTTSADRAYDAHVTLSVTQTPAQGDPTRIEVPDATNVDAQNLKGTYTLGALPHDQVGDQYTLNVDAANQSDVNVGDTTATIGDNGERHLTTTITYTDAAGKEQSKTVTVIIPFDTAKPVVGNPDAALEGFLVNGKPLEGFTPDQLSYTITAKADEKITVKPVAKEGQTVKASDIRQTAWTTTQEWTVEKNGQTRTYTVTLVREHSPEQATADDKFNPADPIAQPSTVEPDSPADTTLVSHGYVLDGKYHKADKDDYTIPEGGVFSYDSKVGQTVKVGVEKTGGMTYRYKVGVLAPDQKSYGAHTYTVTYLTAATHKAELTGINVDGKPIAGFDPAKHEYTVEVKNPEKWTITPQFDKSTGMSVSTHKDGDKATITVSSADNLNTVTYTVTVKQKMKLVEKLGLANTGTTAVTAIVAALALIAAGGIAGFFTTRRRKPKGTEGTADDTATNTDDGEAPESDDSKPEDNTD